MSGVAHFHRKVVGSLNLELGSFFFDLLAILAIIRAIAWSSTFFGYCIRRNVL